MSNTRSTLYESANSSTSTLRPRNARLISYLEDGTSDSDSATGVTSTLSSTSRGVSPPAHTRARSAAGQKKVQDRSVSEHVGRRASNGLWDSWSSIQGIASSLLGSDVSTNAGVGNSTAFKTPAWMKQDKSTGASKSTTRWGPNIESIAQVQAGSAEDRQAILQAKKREALLLSTAQAGRDASGRFKRKGSSDFTIRSPVPDSSEDALVYRHKVQPQDTLAGVTIKYSCQPEVFRKINRFWPNDNIQTRTHVILPVEACSIRGRKIDDPQNIDIVAEELGRVRLNSDQRAASPIKSMNQFSSMGSPAVESPRSRIEEDDYRHDSWVSIPSFSYPVEILRISRRALGYFPPARRKSNSHLLPESVTSSPRSSFDNLRHPPSHAAQQAQLQHQHSSASASLNASPVRRPTLMSTTGRQRSSSTVATATSHSSNAFLTVLSGPGGVGNLRGLRTEMSRPGPGDDPLNQKFSKYLPDVAPPPTDDAGYLNVPQLSTRTSFNGLPRASLDSARSSRSNSSTLGNMAPAGLETLMRRFTSGSANTGGIPVSNRTSSNSLLHNHTSSMGDLIELEVNPDSLHDLDERAGSDADGDITPTMRSTEFLQSKGRNREEDLLNERFPVRGRIKRAYEADR